MNQDASRAIAQLRASAELLVKAAVAAAAQQYQSHPHPQ
jgi:hypothetical protein